MIAMNDKEFEGDKFAIQVIAKGAFVDAGTGDGKTYLIEATTIRMNHVALNAWLLSEIGNCRDCYEDGPDGDAEWEAHKTKYAAQREAVRKQLIADLGIDENKGGIMITQSHSEIFTVVHIEGINQDG